MGLASRVGGSLVFAVSAGLAYCILFCDEDLSLLVLKGVVALALVLVGFLAGAALWLKG